MYCVTKYMIPLVPKDKMDTRNEVLTYCMKAQDRALWLRDYCNKLCTDVVVIVNNSMSTFNPMTLPGDMLQVEKNDICHLCVPMLVVL